MEAIIVILPALQFLHPPHQMEKSGGIVPHVVEQDDANIVAVLADIAIPRMASATLAIPLEAVNALVAEVLEAIIYNLVNTD